MFKFTFYFLQDDSYPVPLFSTLPVPDVYFNHSTEHAQQPSSKNCDNVITMETEEELEEYFLDQLKNHLSLNVSS